MIKKIKKLNYNSNLNYYNNLNYQNLSCLNYNKSKNINIMSIASKFFANQAFSFPYIQINGKITRETSIFVAAMLGKVPSKARKLGIVINSDSGSVAQAHLINSKLNIFSKRNGIQLYTFIEDCAVNAGFLIASNGHKIYADNTSIIGGLEVSGQKLVLNEMIQRVTYANQSSLASQLNNTERFDPSKKEEFKKVFQTFSNQMDAEIRKLRKVSDSVDLSNIFTAKEAQQLGIIHQIGRINQISPQEFPSFDLKRLQYNSFDKLRSDLKKLNIW